MEAIKGFIITVWENESVQLILNSALKLLLAALLSGFIGFEREHSHRPAGFRTHILVAVGSALVMMTSVYIFETYEGRTNMDPARLGAQVISGIGFLGAGTILREGFSVKGLTTAASLWAVSCIGLAVGIGFYEGAIVATFVIYITLNLLKKFIIKGTTGKTLYIETEDATKTSSLVGAIVKKNSGNLHSIEILYSDEGAKIKRRETVVLKALVFTRTESALETIVDEVRDIDGVRDLYID